MAIEIYTKESCTFCEKAKTWFETHGLPYTEIDVSKAADFSAMKERIPGATTVPQIVIDGHVIGGWDVLEAYQEPILAQLRKDHGG